VAEQGLGSTRSVSMWTADALQSAPARRRNDVNDSWMTQDGGQCQAMPGASARQKQRLTWPSLNPTTVIRRSGKGLQRPCLLR
jgi:hypothetical protein